MPTCDPLSRLKGIETDTGEHRYPASFLRYAFPFEGNWNFFWIGKLVSMWYVLAIRFPVWRELKRYKHQHYNRTDQSLRYAFPFEGNWNPFGRPTAVWSDTACDTLSRLKGIETRSRTAHKKESWLAIRFPVWRELKREMFSEGGVLRDSLPYAFPFEGNWNISRGHNDPNGLVALRYAFPFEGNWNLYEATAGSSCS